MEWLREDYLTFKIKFHFKQNTPIHRFVIHNLYFNCMSIYNFILFIESSARSGFRVFTFYFITSGRFWSNSVVSSNHWLVYMQWRHKSKILHFGQWKCCLFVEIASPLSAGRYQYYRVNNFENIKRHHSEITRELFNNYFNFGQNIFLASLNDCLRFFLWDFYFGVGFGVISL